MIDRFTGDKGQQLRIEAFTSQKLVVGNRALAEELARRAEMMPVHAGDTLIEQNADDTDIFFIFSGTFDVIVNGRRIARRGPNDHVGEMAAIQPTQKRSATLIAVEDAIVAKFPEELFTDIAFRYPEMYRYIAQELSRRLLQRNMHVNAYRDRIRVFIVSSAEALPIARTIQNAFAHDPFVTFIWTDGVFRVANYTLESLEHQIDDFGLCDCHRPCRRSDREPRQGLAEPARQRDF